MTQFIFTLSISSLFLFNSFGQINGWTKTKRNDVLTYIPTDIKSGKTFKVTINQSTNLNGQHIKDWLLIKVKKEHTELGDPLRQWKITSEKDKGWGTDNVFINTNGEKRLISYNAYKLENNEILVVQLISNFDTELITKYATKLKPVIEDAVSVFANSSSTKTITSNRKKTIQKKVKEKLKKKFTWKEKQAIRTKPNLGVKTAEIEALINSYNLRTSKNTLYMLLKDGNVYKGLNIPPSDFNVPISKKIESDKWSKWQKKSNGRYAILTSKGWKDLKGWKEKVPKNKLGKRFNLTLKSVSGSSSNYYKNVSVKKRLLILKPDGRFETSSSFKHSGTDATGIAMTLSTTKGKSGEQTTTNYKKQTRKDIGSDAVGRYKVEDYAIEFRFDSGRVIRELFWEFIEDKTYVYIGKKLFYVPD